MCWGSLCKLLRDWSSPSLPDRIPSSLRFSKATTMNKFLCCTLVVSPCPEADDFFGTEMTSGLIGPFSLFFAGWV